ncbi:unnamed protein product [Cyclocybe aegerita]|uniref:Uncharacterized protein n=1 Tax=Cyclocybe aegerita TaxID=1973307 RepID=A0A8S0XF11_CYCAE|nr:unnamed protein product [Cyclocybe aegerita]
MTEPIANHSGSSSDDEPLSLDTNTGVGLSNPQLSQGRRQMLDLVNKLHSTGVQVDIDLPQIAVVGSQSAGKSSLIESISGITLPRAAGTCTRCPTECRLSRSDGPWKCIVSLRFTTDAFGQPLGQARNEIFGGVIYDKSKVEDRIRRAQKAILNPQRSFKDFLDDDEGMYDTELSFSMNCVSLQISGPDVADLSFCDLPGLIASVGSNSKGGENDIALVKSLVTSYIKKPSCIILLTVSCETDFENQGAHHLAKQYDKEGKRTIGVLTKPDRIPTGEEHIWLPFIQNEKEPLVNNWFCVKQPSSNDLKAQLTWEQARRREDEFFATTAPWCEMDAVYQKYLRTRNLVDRLSLVLSDLISKRLPEIQQEIQRTISVTKAALSRLPREPPPNPQAEITSLISDFTKDLEKQIDGVPDAKGLIQSIRPAHQSFRKAIRRTAPNFRPFESKIKGRHIGRAAFLVKEEGEVLDGEDSEDEIEDAPTTGRVSRTSYTADIGDSRSELGDEGIFQQNEDDCSEKRYTNKVYIDQVLQRAHDACTRELPGNYPFIVQKTFIQAIIKEWEEPALHLCDTTFSQIDRRVQELVAKHFSHFGQGHLEQRVRILMKSRIEECFADAKHVIEWHLKVEDQPFSLNTHYLTAYREKFMAYYKGERLRYDQTGLMTALSRTASTSSSPQDTPSVLSQIMSNLAALGISGLAPEDLKKLLPADDMEPALGIMADVRAYFQVAYKRFADNIPLAIDYELVRGVSRDLQRKLNEQLGINGVDGHQICQDLAQESPQTADRRVDLNKKLERLRVANRELMGLGA